MSIKEEVEYLYYIIDMLGQALVEHKHVWTNEEREAYEKIDFDLLPKIEKVEDLNTRLTKLEADFAREKSRDFQLVVGKCELGGNR